MFQPQAATRKIIVKTPMEVTAGFVKTSGNAASRTSTRAVPPRRTAGGARREYARERPPPRVSHRWRSLGTHRLPAEQTLRPYQKDEDEDEIEGGLAPGRRPDHRHHVLDNEHENGRDQRAGQTAEAAEDDDGQQP